MFGRRPELKTADLAHAPVAEDRAYAYSSAHQDREAKIEGLKDAALSETHMIGRQKSMEQNGTDSLFVEWCIGLICISMVCFAAFAILSSGF